jgi:uncharacterized protein (DUF1330 family)
MPAYVLVEIDVQDPAAFERYKTLAPPSIAHHGGRFLVRGGAPTPLEGSWTGRRLAIVEFANAEDARAWWASPEYAEARALRQSCAKTDMLLLEGFEPAGPPEVRRVASRPPPT